MNRSSAAPSSSCSTRSAAAAPRTPRPTATRAPTRSAISRKACAQGRGDRAGLRAGPLDLPNLGQARPRTGDASLVRPSRRRVCRGDAPTGQWGYGVETSLRQGYAVGTLGNRGNAGAIQLGLFPPNHPGASARVDAGADRRGPNCPAFSATNTPRERQVIEELGEEHLRSLKPICYTSADSVSADRRA